MKQLLIPLVIFLLLCTGCGCRQPELSLYNIFEQVDSSPPVFLAATMINQYNAALTFNEPIANDSVSMRCEQNTVTSTTVSDTTLTLSLSKPLKLGGLLALEGRVEDLRGNSLHFTTELWAKNTNPAHVLINEFTTKGSETNPDRVELLVTSRGNLAGLTLYAGVPEDWSDRFVFPDRWVERGTYLVVAFAEGDYSAASYPSALQAGLGSNNGCLSVAQSPEWESPLIDAVVWGNMSTTTFEGFGSASLLSQVNHLFGCGHWNSNESKHAIDSNAGTATRSFCRDQLVDTNKSGDWYVCATKKATFGSLNSLEKHVP